MKIKVLFLSILSISIFIGTFLFIDSTRDKAIFGEGEFESLEEFIKKGKPIDTKNLASEEYKKIISGENIEEPITVEGFYYSLLSREFKSGEEIEDYFKENNINDYNTKNLFLGIYYEKENKTEEAIKYYKKVINESLKPLIDTKIKLLENKGEMK